MITSAPYTLGAAFLISVGASPFLGFSYGYLELVLGVALFFCFLLCARKIFLYAALISFSAALGILRGGAAEDAFNMKALAQFTSEQTFEVRVLSNPEPKEFSIRAIAEVSTVSETVLVPKEKVLLVLPRDSEIAYGDVLTITGALQIPESFATQSGKEFDYERFLKKDGVAFLLRGSIITRTPETFSVKKYLFVFEERLLSGINRLVPMPESGLLAGILLGEKGSLSESLRTSLTNSGLIHIAVLSGYNITLVAAGALFVLAFLFPVWRLVGALLVVLVFVVMTGADATAVRAGVMASLVFLARYLGREADAARLLMIAAVAMVIYNPFSLLYNPSFQLSFLATAGLIFGSPIILSFITRVPFAALKEIIATTIATQIFVLPLLLYLTGTISYLALPANILVLPFIPLLMVVGGVGAFLEMFSHVLALPFAFLTHLIIGFVILVAQYIGTLPFAVSQSISFPLTFVAVSYALLFLSIFIWQRRSSALRSSAN